PNEKGKLAWKDGRGFCFIQEPEESRLTQIWNYWSGQSSAHLQYASEIASATGQIEAKLAGIDNLCKEVLVQLNQVFTDPNQLIIKDLTTIYELLSQIVKSQEVFAEVIGQDKEILKPLVDLQIFKKTAEFIQNYRLNKTLSEKLTWLISYFES